MSTFYKFLLAALLSCGLFTSSFASIGHTGNPTTVGCSDIFTTSITGSNYQWDFGVNSYPRTQSGAGFKSASTAFLTPGSHTIRVLITNGNVVVGDSVTITVVANTTNVTLTSNKPVCQVVNTSVTFTAGPSGFASYAFFVNDSLKQLTASNTYTYPVVRGDSIRVFGFDGTCFTNGTTLYDHTPEPPLLTATINSGDTICAGTSITFTATPNTVTDSFLFYVGGSLNQGSPSNTWTTNTLSDNSNIVTFVINQYGCRNYFFSNSINVRIKPTPVVNLTANDSDICQGATITFTATTAQSNASLYTFSVNNTPVQANGTNTYMSSTLNNNDVVTVVGSLNGCTSRPDSIIIAVHNSTVVNLVSNPAGTACSNSPVVFSAVQTGYSSYTFYNNGVIVQDGASFNYITDTLKDDNHVYVVVNDPGCGTSTSDTLSLILVPAPPITGLQDGTACTNEDTITLAAGTPAGGFWTGAGVDSSGRFFPDSAGVQVLTYNYVNSQTGCISRGTATYVVSVPPIINKLPPVTEICTGSVQLAQGNTLFTTVWSPSTGLSCTECNPTTAQPTETTTYYAVVTDPSTGCKGYDTTTVVVNNLDVTLAFTDTTLVPGDSITLEASIAGGNGSINSYWAPANNLSSTTSLTPVASPTSDARYTIYASSGGCVDSASVNIHFELADTATRIPSAFTPNGDQHNDFFGPVFKDQTNAATLKTFHIYNRYGQLVHDGATAWDGRFKGVDQPVGTYIYYLAVQFPNQDEKHYQGSVTLIR